MKIPIFQVDAFTNVRFHGNPAAVCPLEEWLTDRMMQNIAFENNLSETAFFLSENNKFNIRWFTPTTEVELCGHATLAAAAVIFDKFNYKHDSILFSSKSGELIVTKKGSEFILNFPSDKPEKAEIDPALKEAIGLAPVESFQGREDLLLIYETEEQIRELKPDFHKLEAITQRGVIVSAPGKNRDFVSRFFAPAAGIDEDPVTGSAHTTLTPYWSEKLNKKELSAIQASGRGGSLRCTDKGERTEIAGQAAFYMEGLIEV